MDQPEHQLEIRVIVDKIKAITGDSRVKILFEAAGYVEQGLCRNQLEALVYILNLLSGKNE